MKRPSGQSIIPVALLALVALVGGLVYHARGLEASHRATAESALRDYAALAAWQYTQRVDNVIGSAADLTLGQVQHPHLHRAHDNPLPGPDKLVKFGQPDLCGFASQARFSFRLDLPSRQLHVAGATPDSSVQAAIVGRFARLATDTSLWRQRVRLLVDTLAGVPRAISYGIVLGLDSLPRAVFGVETDPSALVTHLVSIPSSKPLLPPSLLRGEPIDSFLTIEVRRADGGVVATMGPSTTSTLVARERSNLASGQLETIVMIRPEAASALLIGGIPGSRLSMLVALLVASIGVAGLALWQLRRGRELARLRSRFVASVSHELRTPLAQISMFGETLLLGRERSREEGREFLSIMVRETRRLSQLVESVMRFSRSEAVGGTRALRLALTDVGGEVADAARCFEPIAQAAAVTIAVDVEEDTWARADSGALRQVMANLLDNAVKFGPRGQTVRVTVQGVGPDVIIAVTDEGPGIPASEREKIFEPFVQGSAAGGRATTGAGIGLAVVADLVRGHGGRVWIEETGGARGARVSVALPMAAPPAAREPALPEGEPQLVTVG